jgi:hypothetical protein
MAFCRTAGFARVDFESALGERAHVTGYRHWLPQQASLPGPAVVCIDNPNSHNHTFSSNADDYVTFYFPEYAGEIYPRIGDFATKPIQQTLTQATVKLPPGLARGWHEARINSGPAVRIGIDDPAPDPAPMNPSLRLTRVADGKTFEDFRVRTGENSCISVWATGLPSVIAAGSLSVRLNGTDLPAIWFSPETGQVNALLPSGLEPGPANVTVYCENGESAPVTIELFRD